MSPQYGSVDWPADNTLGPNAGPLVTIILDETVGPFVGEAGAE